MMSHVAIQKVEDKNQRIPPVFEEMEKRLDQIRRRAFELFEGRGCEAGRELEDWLAAEREVLGWPALEVEESDKEYEFRVTLPGFEAKEVNVTATPSEIVVHAQSKSEKNSGEAGVASWTQSGSNEVFRRIDLAQPITVANIQARLDQGTLRITAAKAGAANNARVAAA